MFSFNERFEPFYERDGGYSHSGEDIKPKSVSPEEALLNKAKKLLHSIMQNRFKMML